MLAATSRLRLARLLAVLAVILMVGLGQHLHASEPVGGSVSLLAVNTSGPCDEGGKAIPSDAHCATCHLVRATLPESIGVREPTVLQIDLVRPGGDLQPDLAVPDGPARPPRRKSAS